MASLGDMGGFRASHSEENWFRAQGPWRASVGKHRGTALGDLISSLPPLYLLNM